jgi:hypothetical protein
MIASCRPLYISYFTASEFVVMDGTEVVARRPMIFQPERGGAVWTLDGRYVAALTDSKDPKTRRASRVVVAIDATTGQTRQVPCRACSSIAAVGGSQLLAAVTNTDANRDLESLLRIDPSVSGPPVRLLLNTADGKVVANAFLTAGVSGKALLLGIDGGPTGDGMDEFVQYLVGTDSSLTFLDRGPIPTGQTYFTAAAAVQPDSGVPVFVAATGVQNKQNLCANVGQLKVRTAIPQAPVVTDTSALTPSGYKPGVNASVQARDVWWEPNGELHAVLWSSVCVGSARLTAGPSEWRLMANRWTPVSAEPVLSVRPLGEDARVLMVDNPQQADNRIVQLERDGARFTVASGAKAIAAPPISSVRRIDTSGSTSPAPSATCAPADAPCEPAPSGSPPTASAHTGSPFVGEWFVHGGQMVIRSDGTATRTTSQLGTCQPGSDYYCSSELTLSVQLSADGKSATLTIRSVRYTIPSDSGPKTVADPRWAYDDPNDKPGDVYLYRFVSPNVIKDFNKAEGYGNPYMCSAANPPENNGPCGA